VVVDGGHPKYALTGGLEVTDLDDVTHTLNQEQEAQDIVKDKISVKEYNDPFGK